MVYFASVSLEAGERTRAALLLTMRSLAYYDDARAAWVADAGEFEGLSGASAQDIRARATFTISDDWVSPVGWPSRVERMPAASCQGRYRSEGRPW